MGLWYVLTWFPVSKRVIRDNTEWNRRTLQRPLWRDGEFIETQRPFASLRFGKSCNMAYGGCGFIAVYNAMLGVGRPLSTEEFLRMTEELQRKGAAWSGKYGVYPGAIRRYLMGESLSVRCVVGADSAALKRVEQGADVWIVTVFNGKRLREQLHTVCITKTPEGRFVPHNSYRAGEFAALEEAIRHVSRHGARALYTIAVQRH